MLELVSHNDKAHWVENAADEARFIERYGRRLRVVLNPAKEFEPDGRYKPDLYNYHFEVLADLKSQRTPFLTAGRYGVPPEFCVTLNFLDIVRYQRYGGGFIVYFWLQHPGNAANGVYVETMNEISKDIVLKKRQVHNYLDRDGSDGNKTQSYVLDVRALQWIKGT